MADYKATKVTRVTSKQFDDGNWSHSFQTQATGAVWIRGGKNRYEGIVEEGNIVDLTTSTSQKRGASAPTVYCDSVTLVSKGGAAATGGSFGGGFKAPAGAASGGFESNRQSSIEYQSARNAAVEYLKLAVGSNAVKLPEAPAKRLKVMDALLDAYTAQFYTDVGALGALKRVSQDEEEAVKAVTEAAEDDDE